MNLKRMKKALVAGLAAGVMAGGAALGEGQDWRAAAGYGLAAALLAGFTTYSVPNKLTAAELRKLADQAAREGR